MDDLAASFNKAYTANVRQSFFGGVVSTRLQSQNLNKVLPQNVERLQLLKQRKESRASARKKPKATPAEQKAQQRRQLEEKRRRMQARAIAEMQSDVGDKFVPEVHGAASVKKMKQESSAVPASTTSGAKKIKPDMRSPAAASASSSAAAKVTLSGVKRPALQGLPVKPVEKRLSSGQKVMIHNGVPKARKLGVITKTAQPKAGAVQKPASKPSKPAFPSKTCRSCREEKPMTDFYADKRLPGGASHMCSICSKKKGLSGRNLTREEVLAMTPTAVKGSTSTAQTGAVPGSGGARQLKPPQTSGSCAHGAPQIKSSSGSRLVPGSSKFYGSAALTGLNSGPSGGRYGGGRNARSQLDEYEDDFVVDDGEEDDWRLALSQVTRKYYRETHDEEFGNDRMMEASAADIRREEARSKRIGRQEDAEAEREEAERIEAKAKRALQKKSKKKKKRRKGVSALIADEASDSDSEEEEEEDYD